MNLNNYLYDTKWKHLDRIGDFVINKVRIYKNNKIRIYKKDQKVSVIFPGN